MASKHEKVDKAFVFFEQKLNKKEKFKLSQVASYTGWSEATVRTYANKRWLSFLEKKVMNITLTSHLLNSSKTLFESITVKKILYKSFFMRS